MTYAVILYMALCMMVYMAYSMCIIYWHIYDDVILYFVWRYVT